MAVSWIGLTVLFYSTNRILLLFNYDWKLRRRNVRTIAIIGSTGSIGTQTLDVVRANADIRIGALAAGNNIELLEKQVREFRPALVSVQSKDKADALRIALSDLIVRSFMVWMD